MPILLDQAIRRRPRPPPLPRDRGARWSS